MSKDIRIRASLERLILKQGGFLPQNRKVYQSWIVADGRTYLVRLMVEDYFVRGICSSKDSSIHGEPTGFSQANLDRKFPRTGKSDQCVAIGISDHLAGFTPTLIVYGPDGRRLAEPIVGFLTADFYAEHVNRAVEEGLTRLRSPSSAD